MKSKVNDYWFDGSITDAKEYWDTRAIKDPSQSGSLDFNLKELEINLLKSKIKKYSKVIEFGCGNGDTAYELSSCHSCDVLSNDFSEEMVNAAKNRHKSNNSNGKLKFSVKNVLDKNYNELINNFDFAFTQRCLINLQSEEEQFKAFSNILSTLKLNGYYLMIESSNDSLKRLNEIRNLLDLEEIKPPWHNLFFSESVVSSWANKLDCQLIEIDNFSSCYYYMSRVVYARLAKDNNEELRYDSPINILSKKLPNFGDYGPTKMWLWQKK